MKETLGGIRVMSDQGDCRYYLALTDLEVYKKIAELGTSRHKKFEEAMAKTGDLRKALFVASSYPIDWSEKDG